jgi:hypothetical protein
MAYVMGKFKVKHPSFHALPDAIQSVDLAKSIFFGCLRED